MLIDSYGRKLDYLRVSITDRCNLRCFYCMPKQGVEWKPHNEILSFEEILRLVRIMTGLGIKKVKVTGGEPLLRRGAGVFLKNLKEIEGMENVTLTTNGLLLGAYLEYAQFTDSLPDCINISLNALDSGRYKRITLDEEADPKTIPALIDRLSDKGISVKINCVPVRGYNEEEIPAIAALAKDKNIAVRFIELMPLGSVLSCRPVPGNETAAIIEKKFGRLSLYSGVAGNGPAVYYSLSGFKGTIGFINPITQCFCDSCNRLRLTCDGFLKLCLSGDPGIKLKQPLRNGASDSELANAVSEAVSEKPQFHSFSETYRETKAHRGGMSKIGG
ncbi:MAG: GTP 3',8-cyclase MoaA [Treponema sp.]|nr:GTP 3',8-cyclase MoaA [Treponema sp.]